MAEGMNLLTAEQVCDKLKISQRTLRKWTSQRQIPHVKLGRAVRFKESDIDAFIQRSYRPADPIYNKPRAN